MPAWEVVGDVMSRPRITMGERCIETVIEKVVAREKREPTELPPLADVLDPEALSTLVDSADGEPVSVEFTYCGYAVTVDSAGTVDVSDSV